MFRGRPRKATIHQPDYHNEEKHSGDELPWMVSCCGIPDLTAWATVTTHCFAISTP
jgi:hypothetical protein